MLAILLHTIDDCKHRFAKYARVQHKGDAYHETIEVCHSMVPHIREAPLCPVFVNVCVTLVSSTEDEVFGIIFEEGMHSLIYPRCFPIKNNQVVDESLLENFFRKHHFRDKRYVPMQVAVQMPTS
jgi:hypothetical protein